MKIAKTEDEGWCYVGAAICAIALTVRLFTDAVVKPDDILTPHGIIVNSSNIGAVQIGVKLGQTGMQEYLRNYGLCEKTGLPVTNEAAGSGPDGRYWPDRVDLVVSSMVRRTISTWYWTTA